MEHISSDFKEGTVIMTHNTKKTLYNSIVPKAIKWFTGSYYHHAGIVAERDNELWVYEAVANGFLPTKTLRDWLKWAQDNCEYMTFNVPVPHKLLFKQRLYEIVGNPYDYFSLVFFQAIYQLFKKINKNWNVWLGNKGSKAKNKIYCTEGVAYILGYEEWWTYDPKKLFEKCLSEMK